MPPKRKADDALGGLPARLAQEPASTTGTGPFMVYFPSRFDPSGDIACEWESYAHTARKNQYVVVGKTVSRWRRDGHEESPYLQHLVAASPPLPPRVWASPC